MSKKNNRLSDYSRHRAWQLLFQYVVSLILFPVICFIIYLLVKSIYDYYRYLTNDQSSIIFWMAQIAREILPVTMMVIGIAGWIFITLYFFAKPFYQMDQVIDAAGRLAVPDDKMIELPNGLKDVENDLNLVRTQALRNAAIAREAEKRKNDLVVYLAHDLKTPLTSVIGYLNLLQDEPDISPEQRAKYTGIALEKAERLEELINEFFDITRFNLTTITLDLAEISLSRMLEQTVSEFDPILREKNLSWSVDIKPNVRLWCDRDKMERVFDNLIRNAVNYSYSGTEISLQMWETEEDIQCVVKNHGKTIPPEKLERIFDQFFRVDSSRSSATGGSGIGLAISKEIVELHGGSIHAESANEEIVFTVKLLPINPKPKKTTDGMTEQFFGA